MAKRISETITENNFRNFYGSKTFIEKSAIPEKYGFKVATPELIHSKEGSFTGINDCEGNNMCWWLEK